MSPGPWCFRQGATYPWAAIEPLSAGPRAAAVSVPAAWAGPQTRQRSVLHSCGPGGLLRCLAPGYLLGKSRKNKPHYKYVAYFIYLFILMSLLKCLDRLQLFFFQTKSRFQKFFI